MTAAVARYLSRHARRYTIVVCVLCAMVAMGNAFYIELKAQLAQRLIAAAWNDAEHQQLPSPPWPWADTRPVARLEVPDRQIVRYIMNSASSESLAFGPGRLLHGVLPGDAGHALVAGHRDTHFDFLRHLQAGDAIHVTNYQRQQRRFIVRRVAIIDSRRQSLLLQPDRDLLTLITCYPFDAIDPGGPLRYVVTASSD